MTFIKNHNLLLEEAIYMKKWTKENLISLLKKYDIDINYGDGLLLSIVASNQSYDIDSFKNINLFLQMGANPYLIMDDDLIIFDTSTGVKICLDAIFNSFGFKCKWQDPDSQDRKKYLNLEKIIDNIDEMIITRLADKEDK